MFAALIDLLRELFVFIGCVEGRGGFPKKLTEEE